MPSNKVPTKKYMIIFLTLLVISLITRNALAVTITVDGVKEAVWDAGDGGGDVPGSQTDPDEGLITNGYDIQEFKWTNNASNMFFLMDTYATTIWTGTPFPTLIICLDMDNNTATGGTYTNCAGMSGIDRSISATRFGAEIYDSDPNTGNFINVASLGRAGEITEIGAAFADLGLGTTFTCGGTIVAAVYFDNGIVDPDDNTPDTGTFNIGCGGPTAVGLANQSAEWMNPAGTLLVLVLALGLVTMVGYTFIARRQAQTL